MQELGLTPNALQVFIDALSVTWITELRLQCGPEFSSGALAIK
jgi:hypothetical protein